MIVTFLIDNLSNHPDLTPEWGLSVHIAHEGRNYLLDTGASEHFARNADALGIDLAQVDCGVLSHAHYDHADGMDTFFARNPHAPFYLRAGSAENCWDIKEEELGYIGIKQGLLEAFRDRIRFAEGKTEIGPGVWLLPHTTQGLEACGQRFQMYRREGDQLVFDDFCHEQSLVFETDKGLVLFNSCCHGGADVIVKETQEAFPGQRVYAIIGGFHLFTTPAEEVRAFARRLEATGVEHIVTGHCTGQEAFDILREMLGGKVRQMETGLVLEF